jgi:NAD-dependent DNA ligase
MTLPGIGRKTSKLVEAHFHTLRRAFSARGPEWTMIDGIGPKTAQAIQDVIDGR